MLKKATVHFLLATTFVLMTGVDLFAQSRIRFARGRTSATVSGTIAAGANRSFVVGAKSGQYAIVSVSPRNLKIWNSGAPKGESGSSSFETESGDNEFGIYNPTNREVRYTLTISVR